MVESERFEIEEEQADRRAVMRRWLRRFFSGANLFCVACAIFMGCCVMGGVMIDQSRLIRRQHQIIEEQKQELRRVRWWRIVPHEEAQELLRAKPARGDAPA